MNMLSGFTRARLRAACAYLGLWTRRELATVFCRPAAWVFATLAVDGATSCVRRLCNSVVARSDWMGWIFIPNWGAVTIEAVLALACLAATIGLALGYDRTHNRAAS